MRERSIPPRLYSSKNTIFIVAVLFRVLFRYVHPPKQGPRRVRPSFFVPLSADPWWYRVRETEVFPQFPVRIGIAGASTEQSEVPRRSRRACLGPDTGDLVCELHRPAVVTGGLPELPRLCLFASFAAFAKIRISRAQKQFLFAFCRGDGVKDTKSQQLCVCTKLPIRPLSSKK